MPLTPGSQNPSTTSPPSEPPGAACTSLLITMHNPSMQWLNFDVTFANISLASRLDFSSLQGQRDLAHYSVCVYPGAYHFQVNQDVPSDFQWIVNDGASETLVDLGVGSVDGLVYVGVVHPPSLPPFPPMHPESPSPPIPFAFELDSKLESNLMLRQPPPSPPVSPGAAICAAGGVAVTIVTASAATAAVLTITSVTGVNGIVASVGQAAANSMSARRSSEFHGFMSIVFAAQRFAASSGLRVTRSLEYTSVLDAMSWALGEMRPRDVNCSADGGANDKVEEGDAISSTQSPGAPLPPSLPPLSPAQSIPPSLSAPPRLPPRPLLPPDSPYTLPVARWPPPTVQSPLPPELPAPKPSSVPLLREAPSAPLPPLHSPS